MDDAALLRRWTNRRDAQTFNEIVDRFADQVFATSRRIVANDADAEEVAQDCFLSLLRSGGEIRSSLGGWLHGVATNKGRERVRSDVNRRKREQAYARESVQITEAGWDDIQEHVDSALEMLPPTTRDVIVAHFIGRKTQAEIAAELRLSRRAVSHRIQRGLASVRRELGRRGVVISAVAVGSALAADASVAPTSLKASLGKLAIAAGSVSGAGGGTASSVVLGSLLIMKARIAIVCILVCILAGGFAFVATRQSDNAPVVPPVETVDEREPVATVSTTPKPPEAITELVAAATVDEESEASPTLEDLLAISRAELERALDHYPEIEDPQQYASVSGIVLDRDGYPIRGASVLLTPATHWGKLPRTDAMSHAVSSGADGSYLIDNIKNVGRYWINATKPGYADGARGTASGSPIQIEPGMRATGIDFKLAYGPTLHGRVLSAGGLPVSDGIVQGLTVSGPGSISMMQRFSARTDQDGHFTMGFEETDRGNVASLRVQSATYGSSTFPDVVIQEKDPVVLRLTGHAVIHGTVRYSDGTPVSGARLYLYGRKKVVIPGGGGNDVSFAGSFIAVGDPEGRYAVEVDAGLDYEVEVKAGSAGENERRGQITALEPGERRAYDAVLNADTITVRGRIIGMPSGKPFDTALGLVQVFARRGEERFAGSTHMNAQGGYEIVLPDEPGEYTFQARYFFADELSGEKSAPQHLEGGDEIELDLTLPEPQYFSVFVVVPSGKPLAGVSVNALTENYGTFNANRQTNEEGRLDTPFDMPPNSGAHLYLEKPGYVTTWGARFGNQSPGTVHPEETIVLWPAAGFEGDLVDREGNPFADTSLTINVTNRDGQVWPLEIDTDGTGHFTVVDQAPADVVDIIMSAEDSGVPIWSGQDMVLQAGGITDMGEIVLGAE